MFELRDLNAYYSKSHVVQGINLTVNAGEAVALTGRNGVGKTTTLRSVMGLLVRTEGRILLEGQDISRLSTPARANRGIGYVPEERAVFPTMSVEENIMVGALVRSDTSLRKSALQRAYEFFPLLRQRHRQMGGTLSGGQQKMLALARGIALQPKLLMVDEPTEGLMPANVELVAHALLVATQESMTVLVVDSSFDLLKTLCSRMYGMDRGVLIGTYKPTDFNSPDELAATMLGESRVSC